MTRDTLGDFEQFVLLAALRLRDEAYAVSILEEIEKHTGRRPSHGAVFVALRRLEKKGLVRQELGAPTESRGGVRRRWSPWSPGPWRSCESRDRPFSVFGRAWTK